MIVDRAWARTTVLVSEAVHSGVVFPCVVRFCVMPGWVTVSQQVNRKQLDRGLH